MIYFQNFSILLYFNFTVTLICAVLLITFTYIILTINKNIMVKYGSISNTQSVLFIKNIQQTFSAIKDIKILGKENFFRKKIEGNINLLNSTGYKSTVAATYPKHLLETVIVFVVILFLIFPIKSIFFFNII